MTTATARQETSVADQVALGERLGFYAAMSHSAVTVDELARRTGTPTDIVGEWLSAQARDGFLTHDAASGRYAAFCDWPRAN